MPSKPLQRLVVIGLLLGAGPPLTSAAPPNNVRGSVLKNIDVKKNAVDINIGLEEGPQLEIYRETSGKYLGTVVVKKVNPKDAVSEFKPVRGVPLDKLGYEELTRKHDAVGQIKIRD